MALDTEPLNVNLDIIQKELSGAVKNHFCSGAFWKLIMANEKVTKIDNIFLTEEKWISRKSAQSTVTSSTVCCAACPCSFIPIVEDVWSFDASVSTWKGTALFLGLASNNDLVRLVKANDEVNKSFFFPLSCI